MQTKCIYCGQRIKRTVTGLWCATKAIEGLSYCSKAPIDSPSHSDRLDTFTASYIESLLWSTTDGEKGNLDDDGRTWRDLSPECLAQCVKDCAQFQRDNADDITNCGQSRPDEQCGHDFALTRNGHGAGFWDGDYPKEIGDRLTKASNGFGETYLYLGDDGRIYS